MDGTVEIVDTHQHVGSLADSLSRSGSPPARTRSLEEDVESRIARMDCAGVSWALLMPAHAYLRPDGAVDTARVNDQMASYQRVRPNRFLALGTTEPMHGKRGLAEIDRAAQIGLAGLSWHHRVQGCFIDTPWMWPTLERMGELNLKPVFHVNPESKMESSWRLHRLARDFPDMTFLAIDGFLTYDGGQELLHTAHLAPNIVWEMGHSFLPVRSWVERNGSETLCVSADIVGYADFERETDKPRIFAEIEAAGLDERARRNIYGQNIVRVFGRPAAT